MTTDPSGGATPSGDVPAQDSAAPPPGTPPPGYPPPPPGVQRRLVRRVDDRMVAGVAGGLADYFGVDPLLVRIAFIALSFAGGVGLVAYAAGWLLVPSADAVEPVGWTAARRLSEGHSRGRMIAGGVLLIVAVAILGDSLSIGHQGLFWGLALVVVGVLLLVEEAWPFHGAATAGLGAPPPPPPPAAYGASGYGASAYGASAYSASAYAAAASTPPAGPAGTWARPAGVQPGWASPPAWSRPVPSAPRPRSVLGWVTAAVALLAVGTAALLDNAGVVSVSAGDALALGLIVIGLGLVVGAWFGRSRGLIVLGVALLPIAAGAALVTVPITGGAGDRTIAPATVADVQAEYRLAAGQMTVDLSRIDLGGGSRSLTASVAVGHLVVIVPAEATVDVHAQAGAGDLEILGHADSGVQATSTATGAGSPAGGTLHLDLSVGFGQVQVLRAAAAAGAVR